jgi:hypothetical protein
MKNHRPLWVIRVDERGNKKSASIILFYIKEEKR